MTHPQEGGTGGEVSEILFFSAKSKRRPSLIYSMQIIPVCLSIVARRKGVSATRRGGSNWTPISLLVGHPCKLFNTKSGKMQNSAPRCLRILRIMALTQNRSQWSHTESKFFYIFTIYSWYRIDLNSRCLIRIPTRPHAFRPVLSELHESESLSNADLSIITCCGFDWVFICWTTPPSS